MNLDRQQPVGGFSDDGAFLPGLTGSSEDSGFTNWIEPDDFARRFSIRSGNLMWLVGAGASASAGIPTAWNMIWEFKQQLYVSQKKAAPQTVADLSNPTVRERLQAYVDSSQDLPPARDPDEYAAFFETVYPAEADRRAYVDAKIAGAKPSYGHIALATLMHAGRTCLVWTTNFDPLIADGCARVYGTTGALTSIDLDAPDLAEQVIAEQRWPVEIKLHGDFRSRRLKNTDDELRHQDVRLRSVLVDSCRRFGLVVVGYSGRDDSIMDALEETLSYPSAFPSGLYWLHKGEGPPLRRVGRLLARAAENSVEAALVSIENFDEALRDLVRLTPDVDTAALSSFGGERRRWTPAPHPGGRGGWPVVRLNALPVVEAPTVCRLVVCRIGGYSEVREAVTHAGVDLLVARTRSGVLAFGTDSDVRSAFEGFDIERFDLHPIDSGRLKYESGERGLFRDALTRAIARNCGLDTARQRNADLLAPSDPQNTYWTPLRSLVGALDGQVLADPDLHWREGVSARIDWAADRLWLVFEPRIVFDGIKYDNKALAADFARSRSDERYNRQLCGLIDFWAGCLAHGCEEMCALGVVGGVDAVFRVSNVTAFSRRARARR